MISCPWEGARHHTSSAPVRKTFPMYFQFYPMALLGLSLVKKAPCLRRLIRLGMLCFPPDSCRVHWPKPKLFPEPRP